MRAEPPSLHRHAQRAQLLHAALHQWRGDLWRGGPGEAWTPAPANIGVECELGDDQRAAGDIAHGAVDLALIIHEDAQASNLIRHQSHLRLTVGWADAQQHDEARRRVQLTNDHAIHEDVA